MFWFCVSLGWYFGGGIGVEEGKEGGLGTYKSRATNDLSFVAGRANAAHFRHVGRAVRAGLSAEPERGAVGDHGCEVDGGGGASGHHAEGAQARRHGRALGEGDGGADEGEDCGDLHYVFCLLVV